MNAAVNAAVGADASAVVGAVATLSALVMGFSAGATPVTQKEIMEKFCFKVPQRGPYGKCAKPTMSEAGIILRDFECHKSTSTMTACTPVSGAVLCKLKAGIGEHVCFDSQQACANEIDCRLDNEEQ